jgi:tetratricopeptide (TPR) repeat protein
VRKEIVITAIVFFGVGFLAGYIYDAQKNWNAQQKAVSTAAPAGSGMPSGAAATGGMQGLPEGHPPIGDPAVVKALEEQAAQSPQDADIRVKLANYLYDRQQWQPAVEWYQKALALDPKNVGARTDLGTAYFYLGRPRDALREYRQSLQTDPTHQPTIFNSIVVNLDGLHDVAAAQQAWDKLHRMNANYPGLDSLKARLDAARKSGASARP